MKYYLVTETFYNRGVQYRPGDIMTSDDGSEDEMARLAYLKCVLSVTKLVELVQEKKAVVK